jgi:hypothetical protein
METLFFLLGWDRHEFDKKHDGTGPDSTKNTMRHVRPNLCFCIWSGLRVTLCIAVHPRSETSTHYCSCSGGTGTDSTKNALGHVVHFGASRARNATQYFSCSCRTGRI